MVAENRAMLNSLLYNSEEKRLYVNKGTKFAVLIKTGSPPPSGAVLSAVVQYVNEEDVWKFGSVKRCIKHVAQERESKDSTIQNTGGKLVFS